MDMPETTSLGSESGPVQDDWTPQRPMPATLHVQNLRKRGIDEVRIDCLPVDSKRAALIPAGAALFGILGYLVGNDAFSIGAVAIAMLTIGIWAVSARFTQRWRILIRPGELVVERRICWWIVRRVFRIPMSAIESIHVTSEARHGRAIVIATTASTTSLCAGLSDEALTWLKNYIIMEVACLTWRPIAKAGVEMQAGDRAGPNPIMLKPELAVRLIEIFLAQAPEELRQLDTAVQLNDANEIRRHAHWLKSASANVGAHRLSELCQLLEAYASDNDLAQCPILCREVESMLPGVESWLRDVKDNAAEMLVRGPEAPASDLSNSTKSAQRDAAAPTMGLPVEARVLVVDDSAVSREIASEFLSSLVTTVEFATDGRQAIEKWRTGNFDLIFMDCEMIPMNGFEAAQRIREEEAARGGHQIPIVALTGNVLQEHRERCFAVGMDDYIGKPYPPELLQQALDKWLGHSKGTSALHQISQQIRSRDDERLIG